MTARKQPVKPVEDQQNDQPETAQQKLKKRSWNSRFKHLGSPFYPTVEVASHRLKARVDDYFKEADIPTFTGLALAVGFKSIEEWQSTMEDLVNKIAAGKATPEERVRYQTLEVARSQIQMFYEEGIQSGLINGNVGRFVLEVLGFIPKTPGEVKAPAAKIAAEAARQGYNQALNDVSKKGSVAARIAADAAKSVQ